MKIGFDAKRAFNNKSGLGNFSRNIIRLLAKEYPKNQYFLFHPGKNHQLFDISSNCNEIIPGKNWPKWSGSIWRRYRISKIAQANNLDIYHGLSHELPFGIEKTNIKSVVTIHDVIFLRYPELYFIGDRKVYFKKIAHACEVANAIHVISEQTKRDLIKYVKVQEEKIEVIYQSINPIFFAEPSTNEKKEIIEKYKLPDSFILNVGTIEKRKNLLCLLKGMVSARIIKPLVVVGKPTEYAKEINVFLQDHSELKVHFLTNVSDRELMIIYNLAEVSVYPSMFEGFGQPVIESQACGCPVITTNVSSLPEAGGKGALYFNPESSEELGSTLKQLLENEGLRLKMIEQGKENIKRFTEEEYAENLINLYKGLSHA